MMGGMAPAFIDLPLDGFIPRPMRPDEVRHVWWNLAPNGHRLPAERDVIMTEGGQR